MPNRVLTKIHGSEKALKKIKEIAVRHVVLEEKDVDDGIFKYHQTAQEYDVFDFERIIPMPPHIYRWNLWKAEEEKYWKENCWYDWSCRHWWTKWNSSEYQDCWDYISFETARSCPLPIIRELSTYLPDEKLYIERADEAIWNWWCRFYAQDWDLMDVEPELQLSDEEMWFSVRQNVPDDKCKLAREEMKKDFEEWENVCDECWEVHSEDNDKNTDKESLPF